MPPDLARAFIVLLLFTAPIRLAYATPTPAAALPPLPPPPAPITARVDSANPEAFIGLREFVGPTQTGAPPITLVLPVSPLNPGVRLGMAQAFTAFFANVSSNAQTTTLLAPLASRRPPRARRRRVAPFAKKLRNHF